MGDRRGYGGVAGPVVQEGKGGGSEGKKEVLLWGTC